MRSSLTIRSTSAMCALSATGEAVRSEVAQAEAESDSTTLPVLRPSQPSWASPELVVGLGATMLLGMVLAQAFADRATQALGGPAVSTQGFFGLMILMAAIMTFPPAALLAAKGTEWKPMALAGISSAAIPVVCETIGAGHAACMGLAHVACQATMVWACCRGPIRSCLLARRGR
jgi:hypothetical protein